MWCEGLILPDRYVGGRGARAGCALCILYICIARDERDYLSDVVKGASSDAYGPAPVVEAAKRFAKE